MQFCYRSLHSIFDHDIFICRRVTSLPSCVLVPLITFTLFVDICYSPALCINHGKVYVCLILARLINYVHVLRDIPYTLIGT